MDLPGRAGGCDRPVQCTAADRADGFAVTMHAALLRAVNLAGVNAVAMTDLRGLFEGLGFSSVRTLLQSGNVVFENDGRTPGELERLLETATTKKLGVQTDFFVRTSREWKEILARNPFPEEARQDPGHLVVLFLKGAAAAANVKALQESIRGREIVRGEGRQAYAFYPDGQGRSKLTAAMIEKKLGTRCTARNWNTALKLSAAMGIGEIGRRR
jgi:uncharacterized protein (DUF1697 family)